MIENGTKMKPSQGQNKMNAELPTSSASSGSAAPRHRSRARHWALRLFTVSRGFLLWTMGFGEVQPLLFEVKQKKQLQCCLVHFVKLLKKLYQNSCKSCKDRRIDIVNHLVGPVNETTASVGFKQGRGLRQKLSNVFVVRSLLVPFEELLLEKTIHWKLRHIQKIGWLFAHQSREQHIKTMVQFIIKELHHSFVVVFHQIVVLWKVTPGSLEPPLFSQIVCRKGSKVSRVNEKLQHQPKWLAANFETSWSQQ